MQKLINGEIIQSNEEINFTNRCFKFGDGFFETIKISHGKPIYWKYHAFRIKDGFKKMKFKGFNHQTNLDHWKKQLNQLIDIEQINEGRARITFYRNGSGTYKPNVNTFSTLIEVNKNDDESTINLNLLNCGIHLGVYRDYPIVNHALSGIKTCNALPYVMASIYAKTYGYDNAIMVDVQNRVVECTNSNLFIIKDNQIFTPVLNSGCVNGVIRMILMEMSERTLDFEIIERELILDDCYDADEIFITNSIQGIQSVSKLEKSNIYQIDLTNHVKEQFEEYIKQFNRIK